MLVVLLAVQIGPDWRCVGTCDSALVNTARTSGNCTVPAEGGEAPRGAAQRSGLCVQPNSGGRRLCCSCGARISLSARQQRGTEERGGYWPPLTRTQR